MPKPERHAAGPWYEIKAAANDSADVFIYDEIDPAWGVTARDFIRDLEGVKARNVSLRLNSPGGDVFEGTAIFNAIERHPSNWTAYVDGVAASIASVIALAADKVVIADNAMMMIHEPWGVVAGPASEMRSTAQVLDKVAGTIVTVYAAKTGKDEDEIRAAMEAESWFTAQEAVAFGLADERTDSMQIAAADVSRFGYRHVPPRLASHPLAIDPEADAKLAAELEAIAENGKRDAATQAQIAAELRLADLNLATPEAWELTP